MKNGITVKIKDPSYLSVNGSYLYSTHKTDEISEGSGGAVAAFLIDPSTGDLTFINSQRTKSTGSCHISTDRNNRFLFAANYADGSISVFPLKKDGSIAPLLSLIHHRGSGPDKKRQEKAHTHFVSLTPDEKYLCAVDLGIDKIVMYEFDHVTGKLKSSYDMTVHIKPGSGPRHMTFGPDGRYAYLVNELSSDIVVLEYLPDHGKFIQIQNISTLPRMYAGISFCAAIHTSADGNYVFASNRGHDSIAVFSIEKNSGKLRLVSISPTMGSHPRDFAVDPSGKYIFVANTYSSTVVKLAFISDSGILESTDDIIDIPSPTCIKFAEIDNTDKKKASDI
jgi:6-phosphogluconolactonase